MLKRLTITQCPECGCKEIKSQQREDQHCSGEWNETLKFRCGFYQHWSPNFMKVDREGGCERSEKYKAGIALADEYRKRADKLAARMGLPQRARNYIRENLSILHYKMTD